MIVGIAEVKRELNPAYYKNYTHVAPLGPMLVHWSITPMKPIHCALLERKRFGQAQDLPLHWVGIDILCRDMNLGLRVLASTSVIPLGLC